MKCKRIISIIMAALCLLTMSGAFAYKVGEARVAIGANLDSEQIAAVYSDFGIERGVIPEITVTNENERQYLEGLVDDKKIGHKAISCVYITILDDGSGLNVSTKNINWCTEQMYKNALTTAGITDADVKVTAPIAVSGTAALTGIYKAYEDITGNSLSSLAKMVGAEELIVTGQLAEYIGSDEATALINELKGILDITETMSDADVKKEIKKLADQYNVQVTDEQIEQLLKLCRQLEKLDINQLKEKLVSITNTVEKAMTAKDKVAKTVTTITEKITGFLMARAFNISVYLLIPKVWTGISKPPVFSAKADVFVVCTENYLLANLGYASFAVEAGVAYGFAAAPADGLYLLDSIGPGHKPVTAFKEVALKVGAEAVADYGHIVFCASSTIMQS